MLLAAGGGRPAPFIPKHALTPALTTSRQRRYVLRSWDWRWLAFFALQAPLLLLESAARRAAARGGVSLRPAAARCGVLLALGVLAHPLFFPVLTQPAVTQRVGRSVARMLSDLCAAAGPLLGAVDGAAAVGGGGGCGGLAAWGRALAAGSGGA